MMDWAGSIQTRNYGIKRRTDERNLRELLSIILSVLALAAVFFFCSWVRSRIVELGYSEQNLRAEEESLLRTQRILVVEEANLQNPERIDSIARNDLGMTRVRTNQLLSPQFQDLELGGPTRLAMASVPPPSVESRKSSAND